MGAALGDYNGNGRPDIFVTNFADEANALYDNEGEGFLPTLRFPPGLAERIGGSLHGEQVSLTEITTAT